jgi:putative CocE/NonD family hydrolase
VRNTEDARVGQPDNAGMALLFPLFARRLGLQPPRVAKVAHRKVRIPLADGVRTVAEHWTPLGAADAPLVLVRTPYGRMMINVLVARHLAHQGFQVLVQASRGTDGSEGAFDDPFTCEREDGAATVEWLRGQSWYPGSFLTFGDSYLGYAQLALAEAAGDDLAGCVLRVAPTSLYDMFWPGGSLAFKSLLPWCLLAAKDPRLGLRSIIADRRNAPKVVAVGRTAPLLETYRTLAGERIGFWEDWATHPEADDPYWVRGDLRPVLDTLSCPVLVQGGWYDLFLEDSLLQYRRLAERGVPVELLLGPWSHAQMLTKALGPTLSDATAWLREVAGLEDRPAGTQPVRLVEIGSREASSHPTWPEPGEELALHLAADGRLAEAAGSTDASTRYRYDPADPTPAVGGATNEATAGPGDNTDLERRPDVLTFTTDRLPAAVHLLGSPAVDLTFGSDRSDTAVFVRLCEVGADGTSTNLTDRLVRLHEADRGADDCWQLRVSLPPTCARIAEGNRIRLQVSSGAYPRFLRHPGTAESAVTATAFHPAEQVVHHGPAHPGTVRLPLRAAADTGTAKAGGRLAHA